MLAGTDIFPGYVEKGVCERFNSTSRLHLSGCQLSHTYSLLI